MMSETPRTEQALLQEIAALQAKVAHLEALVATEGGVNSTQVTPGPEWGYEQFVGLVDAIGLALTQNSTLRQQLQQISEALVDHFGATLARIWIFNSKNALLELEASAGLRTDIDDEYAQIPLGKFRIGLIAQEMAPYFTNQVTDDPQADDNTWASQANLVSFAGYPLMLNGQLLGVMGLFAQFSLDDYLLAALKSVANLVVLSIENKATEAILTNRATQLETVAQVSMATLTILETDQLLSQVVNLTKARFQLYHAHIYLIDSETESLKLISGSGEAGLQMVAQGWQIPLKTAHSIVATVAQTREGIIVNDVRQTPNFLPNPLLPDTRAELAVPLLIGNQILGVLDVQSATPHAFDREDLQIQTTLAAQVAIALENARLFEEVERKARREALVNHISQRIQNTTSVEKALQTTIKELGQALQSRQVSVTLNQPE